MRRKLAIGFLGPLLLLAILSISGYFYARSHLQQWFTAAQFSVKKVGVSLTYRAIKPLEGLGLELSGVDLRGAKQKYALTAHTARFGITPQFAWPPLRLSLSLQKPVIQEAGPAEAQAIENISDTSSGIPKSSGILLLLCQPTLEIESAKIIPLNIDSLNLTARAGNYVLSSSGVASVDLRTKFSVKFAQQSEALEGNALARYQPKTISLVESAVEWGGNVYEIHGDWTIKEPGWVAGLSGKSRTENQGKSPSGSFTLVAFTQGSRSPYEATVTLKDVKLASAKDGVTASQVNGSAEINRQPAGETSIKITSLNAELSGSRIVGKMKSNLELSFVGNTREEILNTISGKGSVQLKDGELKLVKFASQPLESLSQIPGMGRWIRKTTWEERPVTANAKISVGNQMIRMTQFQLLAPDFEAVGRDATLTFDSHLQANIDLFPKDSLVDLKGIEALKDESGRPSFPLKASGKLEGIVLSMDGPVVERRLRAFVQKKVPDLSNKIQDGLKKLFGK